MRVAVLSDQYPALDPGGAQEVARRCAQGYAEAGHEVRVFTTHDPSRQVPTSFGGVPLTSFPASFGVHHLKGGIENSRTTRALVEALREFAPQSLHAHNVHSAIGWGWLERLRGMKVRGGLTFHDHMSITRGKLVPPASAAPRGRYLHNVVREIWRYRTQSSPFRAAKIRRLIALADWRSAVSSDLVTRLGDHGIGEVRALHNGIDASMDPSPPPPSRPVFLFLGRPTREKGIEALLEGARISAVPMRIVIGSEVPAPAQSLAQRMAGPKVELEFPGWVSGDKKRKLLESCTAVANLSTYPDPFNLTNLEGMERSRPVLGTLWGGTPEVVRDGQEGWLVDPRDPRNVALALQEIIHSPEEAVRRGAAGRARVLERFQWKNIVPQYLALLEDKRS